MKLQEIDDYDLYDKDFDEWQLRGMEAFGLIPQRTENATKPSEEKL